MASEPTTKTPVAPAVVTPLSDSGVHAPVAHHYGGIDPEDEITGPRLLALHLGLCLSIFLIGLDFTVIATAVPVITAEFRSVHDVAWYGGAFYLALCASQPLASKTFVLFPKRGVYTVFVLTFAVGSVVCARARTSATLIGGRGLAGLGASGLFVGGLVVMTTVIPLHKRAVWQGTLIGTFSLASVVGPLVGGALTQHASWRWCFYLNLPVAAAAWLAVLLTLNVRPAPGEKRPLRERLRSLDALGCVLFAGGVVMLLLALQWGGVSYAWNSGVVVGMFVGGGVTLLLFAAQQLWRGDEALIPPRLFGNRNFSLLSASALFGSGSFQVVIYWLPVWFQGVLGVSPVGSGVRYLPTVIADVLAAVVGGGVAQACGYWTPILMFGCVLMSIGCGLLSTIYPAVSEGHWIGYQILGGAGYSLIVTLSQLGIQASLPQDLVTVGASTLLFFTSASCAVWLSVGQTIFQGLFKSTLLQVVHDKQEVNQIILSIGVTNLSSAVPAQILPIVRQAYSRAVVKVFLIPAAAPVLAFLLVAGAKWTSVKKPEQTDQLEDRKSETD